MSNAIIVLVEHLKGALVETSFEVLGIGRKLADTLKVPLYAMVIGKDGADLSSRLGIADAVLLWEEPSQQLPSAEVVVPALKQLMEQKQAGLVLLTGSNLSIGFGAKLAVRANVPFVNFCKNLVLRDGSLAVTSQIFGGKILTDVSLSDGRGVVSIYPGSFPADAGRSERAPKVEKIQFTSPESKVVFRKFIEPASGDIDITKVDVLVSVGRGIQNADNIALAEDLAKALNGAVSSSRPVIDQGWLPLSRQVGKSGMIVKPRCYLAVGISGAPEHVEGITGCELIIAVNTDPKAPIFDVSHYGVCSDALELMPLLAEKIKSRKAAPV